MGVKILSKHLVGSRVYCQNCGNRKNLQYSNNNPSADFFCGVCHEDYQLKSQRKHLGAKGMDGAYPAMIRRLSGNTIPNLFLLRLQESDHNRPARCTEALLYHDDHRREEAVAADSEASGLGRLAYFAGSNSASGKNDPDTKRSD